MKSLITTLLAIGFLWPAGTYAFSVDEIIEATRAGGGIIVESHSSASTGGQTAVNGQVVTTGDVSASSHAQTVINAGSEGGTVNVKVQTSQNGVVEEKEYSQSVEAGKGVQVEVNAKATNEEAMSEVRVDGEAVESSEGAWTAGADPGTSAVKVGAFFTATIPSFFKKVLGFFWGF